MKKFFILPIGMLFFLYSCDDKEPDAKPNIDLAAESLEFTMEKTGDFEGNVTLTGVVKNVGDAYRSNDGQQTIQLLEKPASGKSMVLVSKKFKDLDAGATLEIEHIVQSWRTSQEFPPSFILRISFDPDLYIDGNPQNDDSNAGNNSIERRGQEINELF
ncbi:MAG: hypothetical protein EAS52_09060 [Parapedobacter sp.]|nr:MAG: hypothetical protein EAS52_09060 [Parapedobacter sp.]